MDTNLRFKPFFPVLGESPVFKTLQLSELRSEDETANKKFGEMMKDGFFYLEMPVSCQELLPAALNFANKFYKSDVVRQKKLTGFGGFHDRSKDKMQIESHYAEKKDWKLLKEEQIYSEDLEKLANEMNLLGIEVLLKTLKILGVPEEKWKILTGDLSSDHGSHHFAFNHYRKELADCIGLRAHRDYGFVTVLYINQSGLEGKLNGAWQKVPPLRNYFIINFGKSLEIITNYDDRIKAIKHRVQSVANDRISFNMALDGNPNLPMYSYDFQSQVIEKKHESYDAFMKEEFSKTYTQTGVDT